MMTGNGESKRGTGIVNAAQPGQGIELMLYGMGTVLLFLFLLVYAVQGMSRIVARWFPEPVPVVASDSGARTAARPGTGDIDPKLVAAITAAVHAHRSRDL